MVTIHTLVVCCGCVESPTEKWKDSAGYHILINDGSTVRRLGRRAEMLARPDSSSSGSRMILMHAPYHGSACADACSSEIATWWCADAAETGTGECAIPWEG